MSGNSIWIRNVGMTAGQFIRIGSRSRRVHDLISLIDFPCSLYFYPTLHDYYILVLKFKMKN